MPIRLRSHFTAEAARRGDDIRIVRNGSRGMLWLEPLVEVVTDRRPGRLWARAPVRRQLSCSTTGLLDGADNGFALGVVDEIEWLSSQHRLTFARVGVIDPLSLDDYEATRWLVSDFADALAMSAGRRRRRGHRVWSAWSRRCRLPGRHQMAAPSSKPK